MNDPGSEPAGLPRGLAAQLACLLEATARKPGNVHRFADFEDVDYLDFAISAAAIAGPMDEADRVPLGVTIARALASTRRLVRTNTNLGIVLLLAPLAAVPEGRPARRALGAILAGTTVEDAALVYQAIRESRPGGLGKVEAQDVTDAPTITLLAAMELAADRDFVARQYATGFADLFDRALPALRAGLDAGQPIETVVIGTQLALLAGSPDTLIARKRGMGVAEEASRRAADLLGTGWPEAPGSAGRLAELDRWLRADGHARNPGATADLVTAALFQALRDGTMNWAEARVRLGWSAAPGSMAADGQAGDEPGPSEVGADST